LDFDGVLKSMLARMEIDFFLDLYGVLKNMCFGFRVVFFRNLIFPFPYHLWACAHHGIRSWFRVGCVLKSCNLF
jgi:hypothetical protein